MTDPQTAKLRQHLDELAIPYELMPCDPDLADTQVFIEHYEYAVEDCANTIVVKSKSGEENFAACVLLANCRLDVNHVVRKKLGARKVSFAGTEETQRITGMTVGGVTAIGLPDNLPLWVDSAVMQRENIVLGGSSRSWKILISSEVFLHTTNTEIVEGLARPIQSSSS